MGARLDFADHVIAHILSWPVAIFALGIGYRRRISELIGKLERLIVRHGDTTLEATISLPSDQLKKAEATDLTSNALTSAGSNEVPADLAKAREAALDVGKGLPIVQIREQDIRSSLEQLGFSAGDPETEQVLIRNAAVFQWLAHSERTYRLIFGSQIALLKFLNQHGSQPEEGIRARYAEIAAEHPEFYRSFSYSDWVGFLIAQSLVLRMRDEALLGITNNGQGFLLYLTLEGLAEDKYL